MSIKLNERIPDGGAIKGRIQFFHSSVVSIWRQHFGMSLPSLDQAFQDCIDSGDLLWASYLTYHAIWLQWEIGEPLKQVTETARRYESFNQENKYDAIYSVNRIQEQFVLCLQGKTRSLTDFGDETFDEDAGALANLEAGFDVGIAYYYIMKQIAAFYAGCFDEALEWANRAETVLISVSSMAIWAAYYFYYALTLVALYGQATTERQQEFMEILVDIQEKQKFWAGNCPENFANRVALVDAEIARIEQRESDAMRLYEEAIASARENGFIQYEAIAYEVAAEFYRQLGFGKITQTYLSEAVVCYSRWGASGKVQQLDKKYPHLVDSQPLTPTATFAARPEQLDLLAVIKASQAISSEILPSTLQETLMRLALEHAAAQRGFLLLAEGERLTIHARAEITGEETQIEIVPALPISATTLPLSLLNYVRHTGEVVVLADAAAEGRYVDDEYIMRYKPRSALGLPIMRRARVVGLLYLENNLATGAFTPKQLTALELLAAQAAVSLDNVRIYEVLKESEKELRENEERMQLALKSANIGLFDFNIQDNTLLVDDGWLEILGYSPDEIKIDTDTWWSWIHPDDQPRQAEAFQDHLEGRSPYYHLDEYRARSKSGDWVWLLDHGKVVEYDSDGKPLRLVGIHLNITARKRAEEEIRTLNRELEQRVRDRTAQLEAANKELEAFAYTVSHDLRAPLRHIDGFLELLQKETGSALNEQSRHYMDTIFEATKKMGLLIDDLLSFSRMGRHALSLQQVEMGPLVRDVIRELEPDATGRTIEWRIGDLPSVNGDERMLRIVLTNLISNALKFTRTRPQAWIEIGSLPDQDSESVIFVRDNGVGFDMDYAQKLFGVFQRLHRADDFEGTGIGLASVRRIIARHGGRTWAQGEPDRGAAFYFTLPHTL